MPVETVETTPVSEEIFHEIDYAVMKQAFLVHNNLGRFYDENIYLNDLARLCRSVGFEVETEVPIQVSYEGFSKTYFIDLLINRSVIYELKTAKGFDGAHRRQVLNYLFLCQLFHGKLVNFRSGRVEHEYVSTTLDEQHRHDYTLDFKCWRETDVESARLKVYMEHLLADWGVFLEASLYSDAVVHFFGGNERVATFVDIVREDEMIGRQKFNMLNDKTAFVATATSHQLDYRKYLKSLVMTTGIESVQWVNFIKHNVEFITVS